MDRSDMKYKVVSKALEVSPGILAYTYEEFGMGQMQHMTEPIIDAIYSKTLTIILDELQVLGITLAEDFVVEDSYENINFILLLRKQLSKDCLIPLFKSSDTAIGSITDILESDAIPELFISDLLEVTRELFPLSIDWGVLFDKRYEVMNNDNFLRHLISCISISKELQMEHTDDTLITIAYTEYLKLHKTEVVKYIGKLCDHPSTTFKLEDFDLGYIDALAALSLNDIKRILMNMGQDKPALIPSLDLHHTKYKNYFQYYMVNKDAELTKKHLVMLVVEHIVGTTSMVDNMAGIVGMATKAEISKENRDIIMQYVKIAMS